MTYQQFFRNRQAARYGDGGNEGRSVLLMRTTKPSASTPVMKAGAPSNLPHAPLTKHVPGLVPVSK
jgi:hypothetical protein